MTTSRLFPALFCIIFGFLLGGCGGCDDSDDLSENLTIYSEGSGAPNAEPLFPMQPGSVWEDAILLDSFTYREEVFYRIVARQTLWTGTEQWFSRDETGVWLRGSSADGILEIP